DDVLLNSIKPEIRMKSDPDHPSTNWLIAAIGASAHLIPICVGIGSGIRFEYLDPTAVLASRGRAAHKLMMSHLGMRLRVRMRDWGAWWRSAGRSERLRVRPWPEGLETRALLTSITEYPITTPGVAPVSARGQMTPGPDGNVWFADAVDVAIHRVDPAGRITDFAVPVPGVPWGITLGPNGTIAYDVYVIPGTIVIMTMDGHTTLFYEWPTRDNPNPEPGKMTTAPDGSL